MTHGPGRFEPNTRATVLEISAGLATNSQNHWPSLKRDVGAINDAAYMLFSAGFYYKTFMWPKSFWNKVYEPFIRGAAGLGVSPTAPDPDCYASRFAHCDVLVVGGGPAGLAAALAAGRSGAKVILVDEQSELGGSLLSETDADDRWPIGLGLAEGRRGRTGRAGQCHPAAPHDGHRLLSPEFRRPVPAPDRPSARRAAGHPARAHVESPRQRRSSSPRARSNVRWCSTATTVRA